MGEIAKCMICRDCTKIRKVLNTIISEGITEDGIMYYVTKPDEIYLMDQFYTPSEDFLRNDLLKVCSNYIPKFGKYEIEYFIAKKLMEALLITNDLSYLFNTNIMISDISGDIYVPSKRLKEKLLPLFEVKKVGNVYRCIFLETKLS